MRFAELGFTGTGPAHSPAVKDQRVRKTRQPHGGNTGNTISSRSPDAIITAGEASPGTKVTRQAGTGGHTVTNGDVTAIMAWITANFDPLLPEGS